MFTLHTIFYEVYSVEGIIKIFIMEVIKVSQEHEYIFQNNDFICYNSQKIW